MPRYRGSTAPRHAETGAIGVLVSNLGTPEAPSAAALRPYLREFLSDPRVIELPRLVWQLILNLFVLPTRPRRSAELYRKVWTEEGSPLLVISRRQADGIARRLAGRLRVPVHVALGMRYGSPSLATALRELDDAGCRRILLSAALPAVLRRHHRLDLRRRLRRARVPGAGCPSCAPSTATTTSRDYIAALAASVEELWQREGEPEQLLLSFHGMPRRYFEARRPLLLLLPEDGAAGCRGARPDGGALAGDASSRASAARSGCGPTPTRRSRALPAPGRPAARRALPRLLGRLPRDARGDRRPQPRILRARRRRALPLHSLPQRARRPPRLPRRARLATPRRLGRRAAGGADEAAQRTRERASCAPACSGGTPALPRREILGDRRTPSGGFRAP